MKRATQRGLKQDQLRWLEGNAEKLPVEEGSVDVYTIAFGLRNGRTPRRRYGGCVSVFEAGRKVHDSRV